MNSLFPWRRVLARKSAVLSLGFILVMILVAAFAPLLAPHDPFRHGLDQSSLPPSWVQTGSNPGMAQYPLGTDRLGRDILSRMLYGTRTAIFLAFTAVPLAGLLGTLVGLAAGYLGGKVDSLLMTVTDTFQSMPAILFMVLVILIFRSFLEPTWFGGWLTMTAGFAGIAWVSLARLVRISTLQVKSKLFIEAAVSLGASRKHILIRHLLPNIAHIVWVWVINNIPAVILLEAVLGYIGIGVTSATDGSEFTVISWGGIFFAGRSVMARNPLMLILPSLIILLTSLSFISLADSLRSAYQQDQAGV